jgi:hypothetical protein
MLQSKGQDSINMAKIFRKVGGVHNDFDCYIAKELDDIIHVYVCAYLGEKSLVVESETPDLITERKQRVWEKKAKVIF